LINDNKSNLDTTIKEVKQEFRSHHQQLLVKREELITRLGKAFEAVISNPKDVCEEIKNCLHEEIAEKVISKRDIERYCPDKWKKKTKPKNDKLSFKPSEENPQQQQTAATQDGQQIVVTQEGKSVVTNETSSDTEAYPSEGVNEPGIGTNSNNEEGTADTDTKEELVVMHSLNGEIAPVNKQNEYSCSNPTKTPAYLFI